MESFREFELFGWERCAEHYNSAFSHIAGQSIPTIIKSMGISAGAEVLDVACGPGHLAAAASKAGAKVVGIDFSETMLSLARKNYPELCFESGDAEALSFESGRFDFVVMNFGIPHLGQPERAFAEARRVLKSAGSYGFTAWEKPTVALGFAVVLGAIEANHGLDVDLPAGPSFFKYSDEDVAVKDLVNSGFKNVTKIKIPLSWRVNSTEDFFSAFYNGTARTGALLRAQPQERLERIAATIASSLNSKFRTAENTIEVPMDAVLYIANS